MFARGGIDRLGQRVEDSKSTVRAVAQTAKDVASGKVKLTNVRFRDDAHLMNVCQRIVSQVGRRVDESSPICDARLADGSRANVEMQGRNHRTLAPRLVYYGTRNYSVQVRRGEGYERLRPTSVIAWVVEPLFPKLERLHSIFQLRELHTNTLFSEHFSIHLLQLSKPHVPSPLRLPCYDAKVERWARFFNARSDADLDRLAAEDPIMKLATQILDDISRDFEAYFHAMRIADEIALDKIEAREEGEAKGRAEILLKQLGLRFGRLSDATQARVEAGTVAELDLWAARVLTAASLEEVLAP